jgi:ABC-type transport system substrate-binding protein
MVPAGVPGRSDRAFGQRRDPAAARAALARAGFPGGKGFPEVTLVTGGSIYDAAVVDQLRDALGITVRVETMPFNDYFARLAEDPPAFWGLGWVADYPGHNDFLGILLGSGETNNFGRWSSPEFDAAIAAAKSAEDPALARSAYERAESVVQRDVPVIPVSYGTGWALARDGLLGAEPNGLGILRMAGLAWESP